ncbi:MAG: glycine cleavage system aminomethyltransferase GcvT [Caldicoprobacterales bacterium]|nr:glycine cleavage system aminomethyltransferase GcvT [Clostridiales bacterium]
MEHLLKTPLYPIYEEYGAKVVDFAGWALPIQYEGIVQEHHAVRNTAGLFDVSHMGELEITGPDAIRFLDRLLTNKISSLKDGQVQYSVMVDERGGILDDVLVYRFQEHRYWVIANAANRVKDFEWMQKHAEGYHVEINDLSFKVAQFALQGPKASDILKAAGGNAAEPMRFFQFAETLQINGINCLVSRTGYTGEDGFELYFNPEHAITLWRLLLETGRDYGLKPAGLGCRDTLRFEACLPLYGHELDENITPFEAGLDWVVKLNKPDFIGREALFIQKENGVPRKLIGFELQERGIPRSGYEVHKNGNQIGYVTTGYYSPTLKKNIGLALIDTVYSNQGEDIQVIIRGKAVKAIIVDTPFYSKKYKK